DAFGTQHGDQVPPVRVAPSLVTPPMLFGVKLTPFFGTGRRDSAFEEIHPDAVLNVFFAHPIAVDQGTHSGFVGIALKEDPIEPRQLGSVSLVAHPDDAEAPQRTADPVACWINFNP